MEWFDGTLRRSFIDALRDGTYSFINDRNERTWVKFHFRSQQGIENLTDAESEALVGKDRETHQRDLFDTIERGEFPRWTLLIQVMTDDQAKAFPFNPFDLTKVWPKGDFPLMEVGYFELNRNPENVFAEVEQASFSPAHIVPGIGFSPDKMLQARLFSYGDAARYRLGVNHHLIPVNAPKCPYHNYHRDGAMRTDGNLGRTPSYFRTAEESGPTSPISTSRRSRSMAPPRTGITVSTTTTTSSRGICSVR